MLAALEANDITHSGIEPEQVAQFKDMFNINVYTVPTSGYDLIVLNQRLNGWEGFASKKYVRLSPCLSIKMT